MSVDIQAIRDAQSKGFVVGVVPRSGRAPAMRLEIDEFLQNVELANLYFLALERFMSSSISGDPFSYYEISGIHGQPARAWDAINDIGMGTQGRHPRDGYCCHGSALFPTWHRVYLAQFEQALFLHAADIAPRLRAEAALDQFRLPYFDPFQPRQQSKNSRRYIYGVPVIFTIKQIMVRRPETPNKWEPMENPLYQFNFPQDRKTPAIEWPSDYPYWRTVRGWRSGIDRGSDHGYVIDQLDNDWNPNSTTGTAMAETMYRILFRTDYKLMSNHFLPDREAQDSDGQWKRIVRSAVSLEGIHDNLHVSLGLNGHMQRAEYASFDPSFWLHHCNIDRIFAIWQVLNSKQAESYQWWDSLVGPAGTFVEPAGTNERPNTPLAPFRKSGSRDRPVWWTSDNVRNHTSLGYDYPETARALATSNPVASITAWANDSFGWVSAAGSSGSQAGDPKSVQRFQRQTQAQCAAFPGKADMLLDGRTLEFDTRDYLGSKFVRTATATAPSARTAAAPLPQAVQSVLAIQKEPDAKPAVPVIPSTTPAFEHRFDGLDEVIDGTTMKQWGVTFRVEKFALGGSFEIHFFLGDFTENPNDWALDPDHAGSSGIFATTHHIVEQGGCENCAHQAEQGAKYYDSVPLTQALLKYYENGKEVNGFRVTSLEPDVVVPYLTRNLHWRITGVDSNPVPRESLPSLKIAVYSEDVTLPQTLTTAPRFANQQFHTSITNGRAGGLNDGEHL